MLLKFLDEKYLVSARIKECSSLIQEALNEASLKNVTPKKEAPPHYLLVTYGPGWVGKALEMEFVFKERQNGTEVSVRWPYAKEAPSDNQNPAELCKQEKERKRRTERLIDKFKNKIGATDILTS
jgi:hypothetical protein